MLEGSSHFTNAGEEFPPYHCWGGESDGSAGASLRLTGVGDEVPPSSLDHFAGNENARLLHMRAASISSYGLRVPSDRRYESEVSEC